MQVMISLHTPLRSGTSMASCSSQYVLPTGSNRRRQGFPRRTPPQPHRSLPLRPVCKAVNNSSHVNAHSAAAASRRQSIAALALSGGLLSGVVGAKEAQAVMTTDKAAATAAASPASLAEIDASIEALQGDLRKVEQLEVRLRSALSQTQGSRSAALAAQAGPQPLTSDVLELLPATWDVAIGQPRATFVEFYAPWCPYCKRLEPIWSELAADPSLTTAEVQVARINSDTYQEFMDKYDIQGFPTLVLFKGGRPVQRYRGQLDLKALRSFATGN